MWLNRILILTVVCLITVECSKHKKDGKVLKKEEKEIKKKVSSSRVPNGGRKGPMSGGSWDSTLSIASLPVILPLPKKKKKEKKESQRRQKAKEIKHDKQQKLEKNKKRQDNRKKPQMTETDMNPKTKRSTDEFLDSHEVVQRIRRNIDDSWFTDEEKKLRDEWLNFDEHVSNIPSVEAANFLPDDFKFIYDAGKTLVDAYKTLKPEIKNKRSINEEEEDEQEDEKYSQQHEEKIIDDDNNNDDDDQIIEKRDVTDYDMVADDDVMSEENVARDMRVREILPEDEYGEEVTEIVSENSDYREPIHHTIVTRDVPINYNGNCKAEEDAVDNALKASKVVDNIVAQLGINKDTIIEDTKKCIEKTQRVTREFDERFRRHIIHARGLVDARVHKRREIEELKRMFDSDQKEAEKISAESELCSKIEMQLTTLEVAEYYAVSNAKDKLQKCRSTLPATNNNFHFANVMPVTYPTQFTPTIMTYPQPQVIQTPSMPYQMFHQAEPVTLQSQLPSIGSFFEPQKTPEQQQNHEIGMQRHFDSAPNPSQHVPPPLASVLHQPHLESHSYEVNKQNYGQPLAFNRLENYGEMVRQNYQILKDAQNMFKYNHGVKEQASFTNNIPAVGYFNTGASHMTNVQHHVPPPMRNLPPLSNALLQPHNQFVNTAQYPPFSPYSQSTIINAFAGKNKPKLSHPDHHHSTTDSNQDREDWQSSLSFPGTTYSPPPSWLQSNPVHQEPQKEPSVPFQFQPNENQYPQHYAPSKSPVMPFVPPQPIENHPSITQIAGEKHKEGEPGMVAPFSTLKPYNPYKQAAPRPPPQNFFNPPPGATAVLQNAPIIQSFTGQAPNQVFPAPSMMTNSYATPQHEVINAGPGTEVITINKNQPNENQNKPVGQLPDYLLAVDMAKYPVDSTDRLRDGNKNNNETENKDNENNEKGPKRQFSVAATTKSDAADTDVKKAVKSVNYIGENTGFSPHGIEVLIDGVKETVKRQITLSESLLNKDAEMEKEFCGQDQGNINNVAQKSELDKRSEIRSLACENVKKKHEMDRVQLEEAKDKKNKIAQMEMIQTEIEVAKYYAQITKDENMKNIDVSELIRASRSPSPMQQ